MWLQELKSAHEYTINQEKYEKGGLEQQQQQQAIHRATSLSATAASVASRVALAEAALKKTNVDPQVGSKGHLSLNELLEYINSQPQGSSGSGKSKKAKASASKRAGKK